MTLENLHHLIHGGGHTCPRWLCFTFDNPLRRLVHDPRRILGPLVSAGDRVLDLGPGTGYFTMALAELVGLGGEVVAADIQETMIAAVGRRAEKRGLPNVRPVLVGDSGLRPEDRFDFVLMFWMLHEVDDRESLLRDTRARLEPDGRLLVVEPLGHVSGDLFAREIETAERAGFQVVERPRVALSRAVLLRGAPPRLVT
jgi:ubiquinone/menaquinone biosynthesis C-methylase UbiE